MTLARPRCDTCQKFIPFAPPKEQASEETKLFCSNLCAHVWRQINDKEYKGSDR